MVESKEGLEYKLTIVVHRHGPKESMSGPLSPEGEEITEKYFADAYEGITFDGEADGVDIEYSPIRRAEKTAQIYSEVVRKYGIGKIKSSRADERLSEGSVAEHPELISKYGGRGGKWLKGWMMAEARPLPDVKTGKEAAADFTDWLLSKISERKRQGGIQEVDAFSNGPAMAAFLLKFEEGLKKKIFPEIQQGNNVFESVLNYLSHVNFYSDSSKPDIVYLSFYGKRFEVKNSLLRKLVRENRYMAGFLKDVTNTSLRKWIHKENLSTKKKRIFEGFEIVEAIDGGEGTDREISLVTITEKGVYPQHVHRKSDALFVIVSGSAILLSGKDRIEITKGDRIKVPRGMPHGFELKQGKPMEFISIQAPPIRDKQTGAEDFHLLEIVA